MKIHQSHKEIIMKNVVVLGTGYMATEYIKVLTKVPKLNILVIGRGQKNIDKINAYFPEISCLSGGLDQNLNVLNELQDLYVINAVSVPHLASTTKTLLNLGIKNILLEKPGGTSLSEIEDLIQIKTKKLADVRMAYNRRFYRSVEELLELVKKDGGIKSVHFEFTEWSHTISSDQYDSTTLNSWLIANSSHVIDTVFFMIGFPRVLKSFVGNFKNEGLIWHPSGTIFTGAGISTNQIPFSYHSNWQAPGRWSIEVLSNKNRYYLKPMEGLQIQKLGSVIVEKYIYDDSLDQQFKPGLFKQVIEFLSNQRIKLISLEDQLEAMKVYSKIGGY